MSGMFDLRIGKFSFYTAVLSLLSLGASCARQPKPVSEGAAANSVELKRVAAGQEYSGFLKDYSQLKPNPSLDGTALTFTTTDALKNVHRYIGVIVDPVEVYLSSDADSSKLPPKAGVAAANYFRKALINAVSGAFPVVDQPGPLVLRLRAAIVGIDAGNEIPASDRSEDPNEAMNRAANITKVSTEMELLDSETGEQIAAMVDRANLGAGAEIGAVHFSRREKGAAAREAFDGWAGRVREFLDAAHQLSPADAERADKSYQPYTSDTATH
jgi:hypothetical protein